MEVPLGVRGPVVPSLNFQKEALSQRALTATLWFFLTLSGAVFALHGFRLTHHRRVAALLVATRLMVMVTDASSTPQRIAITTTKTSSGTGSRIPRENSPAFGTSSLIRVVITVREPVRGGIAAGQEGRRVAHAAPSR